MRQPFRVALESGSRALLAIVVERSIAEHFETTCGGGDPVRLQFSILPVEGIAHEVATEGFVAKPEASPVVIPNDAHVGHAR